MKRRTFLVAGASMLPFLAGCTGTHNPGDVGVNHETIIEIEEDGTTRVTVDGVLWLNCHTGFADSADVRVTVESDDDVVRERVVPVSIGRCGVNQIWNTVFLFDEPPENPQVFAEIDRIYLNDD